jgi:hypothetical protein
MKLDGSDLEAAWHYETKRLDGCAYFRVEVGKDAQAAGTAAQEDGQHPGPGANTLLLVSRISLISNLSMIITISYVFCTCTVSV